MYLLLWWRAFSIVCVTAINVVNVSQKRYGAAFITGGVLSAIWWGNTRTAAVSDLVGAQWVYAFGAACGTVAGIWIGGRVWAADLRQVWGLCCSACRVRRSLR